MTRKIGIIFIYLSFIIRFYQIGDCIFYTHLSIKKNLLNNSKRQAIFLPNVVIVHALVFWSISVVTFGCDPHSNNLLQSTISFTYYLVQSPSPVLRKIKKIGKSNFELRGFTQFLWFMDHHKPQTQLSDGQRLLDTDFQLLGILT